MVYVDVDGLAVNGQEFVLRLQGEINPDIKDVTISQRIQSTVHSMKRGILDF